MIDSLFCSRGLQQHTLSLHHIFFRKHMHTQKKPTTHNSTWYHGCNLPLAQLEVFNSSLRSYRARPDLQRVCTSKLAHQELICMIDPALCEGGKKKTKSNTVACTATGSRRTSDGYFPTGHSCQVKVTDLTFSQASWHIYIGNSLW